jgi:hypothetical protein
MVLRQNRTAPDARVAGARCEQTGDPIRFTLGILLALTVLSLGRTAAAQSEHRVSLRYQVDPSLEGCPTRFEFENSVSRQLAYNPFRDLAQYRVVVRASPTGSGMSGRVLWSDTSGRTQGERAFVAENRDCGKLVRSIAFALVVQLQLLDAAPADGDETTPADAPAEPSVRPAPRATGASPRVSVTPLPPDETPESFRARSLSVGLGPMISSGLAPDWSILGRVFIGLRFEVLSLELGGVASWPATWRASDGSGFDSNLVMATFSPCLRGERFSGCAVVQLGQLGVEGTGVDEPRTPSAFVGQAGARFAVSAQLGPVVTSVHLDALQTFTRWTVELNDTGVWTMPGTTFQLGIDVELPLQIHP